jgi:ribosomal protein S27AE
MTETTPIPTIYDEENLIKEYCMTERFWCGFCHAVFFDKVLLIVDGRYWCGFCHVVFFYKVLLTL